MWIALLSVPVGVGCVVGAAQRWLRLRRSREPRLPPQAVAKWPALLGASATASVAHAVLHAPTRAHALAELDDSMREAEYELEAGRRVAPALARVALLAGSLAGVVEILAKLDWYSVGAAVFAMGLGTASALGCYRFGRLADSLASEARTHWNRVAGRVERWLEEEAPPREG